MKPALQSRIRQRHRLLVVSFCVMVLAPALLVAGYLVTRAADQYASSMSFSIRSEDFRNPMDALAGLGQIATGTSSDADIVYEFIGSQKIMKAVDANLDLRHVYSHAEGDPVFTVAVDASVEELLRYWRRMVRATLNKGSGLIRVESFAFDPQTAQTVNLQVLEEAQKLVDRLSLQAREDATRHAAAGLEEARERLKVARQNLSAFRAQSQVIDPSIALRNQGGVSGALQQQLAEALIEFELLVGRTSNKDDPRVEQARLRIEAIRAQLAVERTDMASDLDQGMVSIIENYEALVVEKEFAEQAFLSAAAIFDSAQAEAKRRTKYLAVHIEPTLADTALYPRRLVIAATATGFLILIWAVFVLVAYSVRDRR